MDSTVENQKDEEKSPTIRQLYPELTEEQLQEAEENLHRYFEIAMEICEEEGSHDVDSRHTSSTMEERSNKSLKN